MTTDIKSSFGVQSYCFRNSKDNARVAALVKQCGLSSIEVCAVHADFNDPSGWDELIKAYADAGVQIVSIGVETITDDADAARKRFEFARKAGCQSISVNFQPGTWQKAVQIAAQLGDEYDLNCGIHNHGGYHWLGNMQMLDHVFANSPKRVGLCLDTAWALDAKQDPLKMAEKYADRLYGVHIKDFIFDRARQQTDVIVGTGNLDLPALLKTMTANDFDGMVVLEYEGDVEDPVPALTDCVKAVRNA